jgi:hypothetical protein
VLHLEDGRFPKDHHFERLDVSELDVLGVHVRPALDQRVGETFPSRTWSRDVVERRADRFEHDERAADLHLGSRPERALGDAGTVDDRPGFAAEIDERDVVRRRDLDDRVPARREHVVDVEVALRIPPHVDELVRESLASNEPPIFVESESEAHLALLAHVSLRLRKSCTRISASALRRTVRRGDAAFRQRHVSTDIRAARKFPNLSKPQQARPAFSR